MAKGQKKKKKEGCVAFVQDAKLWSPHEPHLYDLRFELVGRWESPGRGGVWLSTHHVITSERFEPIIMQAVGGLRSRLNVRLRSKRTATDGRSMEMSSSPNPSPMRFKLWSPQSPLP